MKPANGGAVGIHKGEAHEPGAVESGETVRRAAAPASGLPLIGTVSVAAAPVIFGGSITAGRWPVRARAVGREQARENQESD
jgi:hypothetical protein